MDIIREIESFILAQWLNTGRAPSIEDIISLYNITEDVITRDELETILIMYDEDND